MENMKTEWQAPTLQHIGDVGEVTKAVNVVGGGDSIFSELNPEPQPS